MKVHGAFGLDFGEQALGFGAWDFTFTNMCNMNKLDVYVYTHVYN